MKAIETTYRGWKFRSRLEARWAVFFDALRIKWEYEPEGFELSDGTRYLPDFYLHKFDRTGVYVEIKPEGDTFEKARKFARESPLPILLADGLPGSRAYVLLTDASDLYGPAEPVSFFCRYLPGGSHEREYRFYWGEVDDDYVDDTVQAAADAARAARFEFGGQRNCHT